ncbi:hypothetical protein C7U60_18445 [Mesorhizobium plurifarium]|nr:hypothetical protein C7U60_18445 [Mesorhizobium plurifarium]
MPFDTRDTHIGLSARPCEPIDPAMSPAGRRTSIRGIQTAELSNLLRQRPAPLRFGFSNVTEVLGQHPDELALTRDDGRGAAGGSEGRRLSRRIGTERFPQKSRRPFP